MSVLLCSILGWLADVAVYQAHTVATLKKVIVQISALEPVTIIFLEVCNSDYGREAVKLPNFNSSHI